MWQRVSPADAYGEGGFGRSILLARHLTERGVRFVMVTRVVRGHIGRGVSDQQSRDRARAMCRKRFHEMIRPHRCTDGMALPIQSTTNRHHLDEIIGAAAVELTSTTSATSTAPPQDHRDGAAPEEPEKMTSRQAGCEEFDR